MLLNIEINLLCRLHGCQCCGTMQRIIVCTCLNSDVLYYVNRHVTDYYPTTTLS